MMLNVLPPNEPDYKTILDIMPSMDVSNPRMKIQEAEIIKEQMSERGRTHYSSEEVCFIMLIDHYITTLEKAKSMIMQDRFTVQFIGDKEDEVPDITDFAIIPIVKKNDKRPTTS